MQAQAGAPLTANELALIKAAVAVASGNVAPQQQPRLQQALTHSALQESGRELLQQAADGKVDRIKELIKRGAPFTTDWVRRERDLLTQNTRCPRRNRPVMTCMPLAEFSSQLSQISYN